MFALRLKRARERAGLNQTELGRIIGVEQQQIHRWESGRNTPSLDTTLELAIALNVSGDYMLGLVESFTERMSDDDMTPLERRVVAALRRGDKVEAIKSIVNDEAKNGG